MTAGIQLLEVARQNGAKQILVLMHVMQGVKHVGNIVPEPAISAMKFQQLVWKMVAKIAWQDVTTIKENATTAASMATAAKKKWLEMDAMAPLEERMDTNVF